MPIVENLKLKLFFHGLTCHTIVVITHKVDGTRRGGGESNSRRKKTERKIQILIAHVSIHYNNIIVINYTRRVITPYIRGCLDAAAAIKRPS